MLYTLVSALHREWGDFGHSFEVFYFLTKEITHFLLDEM